jgi:type I restriction enzyme S subunit
MNGRKPECPDAGTESDDRNGFGEDFKHTSTRWNTGRIGDVCRVVPGYAFKSRDWQTEGVPVVKIKNITGNNSVDLAMTDCVPESLLTPKLQKFVLKDGDIGAFLNQ